MTIRKVSDRAITTRDAAGALAAALRSAGTSLMFGVPGGGANLDTVGAAEAAGIGFVLAHDESAACIMAATHGLLTSSVGAAVVTRGPGLTNAVTGLAQATLDRFPLVLVSDVVSSASAARVPHQRLDQQALAAAAAKWSGTLGAANQHPMARAATTLAGRSPAGGVHLALDVTADGDPAPGVPDEEPVARDAMAEARRLVAGSRHPVVIAGLEAARDRRVTELLGRLGCPVYCTYQGKGVVADSSPLSAGLFTNGAAERPLVERADLVLAVGVDPVELIPAMWTYDAPVIMLHPSPVDGAYFGEPHVVPGPLAETLGALGVEHQWEPDAGAQARKYALATLDFRGPGLTPHQVVREVAGAAPPRHTVTVDAGAHMLVAMPFWEAAAPNQVLISNGLATMGFALPAAIGAALARPRDTVVCLVGDGGLGMTLAELETLARLDLDVVVVVFNDAALSLIEIKQTDGQGGPGSVHYRPTDFAALARGMGVPACTVDSRQELRAQLADGLRGPWLIDARVSPECYPHVLRVTRG
jgi:acetolactate synthase-1/2/3 large subunit